MDAKKNSLPKQGRGSSLYSYQGKAIDDLIHEFMEEENIPGMALAIVQAPYIPRVVGYGLSDVEKEFLASTKTMWSIGPISQGFAAVAIMQLYEAGKLNLKDKASMHLANLPPDWKEITVMQLLQHATGIADYRMQKEYDSTKEYSSADLIALVKGQTLKFDPGTQIEQSATNFLLLAEIVEQASKLSYHDFVTQNQIEHLGLKHTGFVEDLPHFKQENLSETNSQHKAFLTDKTYIDPTEHAAGYGPDLVLRKANRSSALKGFGDIWASAEDVSFWDIGLAGTLLIKKPENRDLIYKTTTLDNGKKIPAVAGWQFYHHKGLMDIKGSVPGFSCFLSRFTDPKELLCVTLLANKEGIDLTHLARQVASSFGEEFAPGVNEYELYAYESIFEAKETMQRIENELKALKIPIFAKFDHAKNAQEAGLELRPTEVIVFGSPNVGTKLMQENQSISIDLPLRIAVWENEMKSVWIGFPNMKTLSAKYNNLDEAIISNMQTLLEKIVRKSANIYKSD